MPWRNSCGDHVRESHFIELTYMSVSMVAFRGAFCKIAICCKHVWRAVPCSLDVSAALAGKLTSPDREVQKPLAAVVIGGPHYRDRTNVSRRPMPCGIALECSTGAGIGRSVRGSKGLWNFHGMSFWKFVTPAPTGTVPRDGYGPAVPDMVSMRRRRDHSACRWGRQHWA